jgi:hypothetical protein
MTTEQALEFLRQHQPLASTGTVDEAVLGLFDEVRQFFLDHPDARCVPLLLNSFGEGDGHGIYQLVEDTIARFPASVVVPALRSSLRNTSGSVRYWSAQIAANFPVTDLAKPLIDLLHSGSVDERIAAVTALEAIGGEEVGAALRLALDSGAPDEVKNFIREVLREMQTESRS